VNFIAAYATHPLVASTLRGWVKPEFIQLSLLANPNVPLNFNALEEPLPLRRRRVGEAGARPRRRDRRSVQGIAAAAAAAAEPVPAAGDPN